ncbi:Inversin-A [Fasciolopsis buskii]|uniref:Inversin-A n=1 Tax=Fasciolopsis buskii TaxID=27845 RepID=A0A8E0RXR8_9TREM|nr:Inversin-A [Fasciolopsis buski]
MGTSTPEGNTSYDEQVSSVLDACDRGDVKRLGEFIISGGELNDLVDKRGRNALHHCVKRLDEKIPEAPKNLFEQLDRIKCARIIVKTDSAFLSQLDLEGNSPIHLAVLNNDMEFVRAMQEFRPPLEVKTRASSSKGITSESQLPTAIGGRTVIHLAVLYGYAELLDSLLEMDVTECINELDEQGATALHYAVQLPRNLATTVIESLIKRGKADLNAADSHGRTALSWAATIGAHEAVTELLQLGAKLNIADECGLTPLHCAASRGNRDIVQSMLNWISVANLDDRSKMSAFRDVPDKDGCTPIFYSVTMGHPEVTKCLLEYGANVQVQDVKGRSLAHCLARLGAVCADKTDEKVDRTKENAKKLTVQMSDLLAAGLNPWITTNTGAAPLHEACLLRNVPFVRELSKQTSFAPNVDTRDAYGHTALHLVVAASWSSDAAGLELCEILLQNGASVNASTLLPQGGAVTSLDLAIMNEKEENVRCGKLRVLLEAHGGKRFDQLCRFTKGETSDPYAKGTHTEVQDPPTKGTSGRKAPVERKANRILVKSASTMTPEFLDVVDEVTYHNRSRPVRKSGSRVLVDAEANHEGKTHATSVQNSRSSQTDKSNLGFTEHNKTGSWQHASNENSRPTQIEIGTQYDESRSKGRIQEKAPASVCSQISKTSSLSKLSTNSSSTSVRVDTPSSSATEPDKCERMVQRAKSKNREHGKASRSKGNTPYSQAYLERELPGILQRYLSHDEFAVSPMTGRSRMPKPTLSPYLIPLVPRTNPLTSFPRKSAIKSSGPIHSRSPRREPLTVRNADRANPQRTRFQSAQQKPWNTGSSCPSLHRDGSAPNLLVSYPPNRKAVQKILSQCLNNTAVDGKKSVSKDRPKTTEKRKVQKIHRNGHCLTRSAMGGEISPIGIKDDLDNNVHSSESGCLSRQSSVGRKQSAKDSRLRRSESRNR